MEGAALAANMLAAARVAINFFMVSAPFMNTRNIEQERVRRLRVPRRNPA
jgi:hypothetical protein